MVLVDALTHLNGQRHIPAGGLTHCGLDDSGKEVGLPGQGGAAAQLGDLGDGAAEVQINVVGAIFFDHHADRLADVDGVHTVNLNGTNLFVAVMVYNTQRLGVTFHQGARGDHLGHVQAATVVAAESAEGLVGDTRHRGQHHRGVDGMLAQL